MNNIKLVYNGGWRGNTYSILINNKYHNLSEEWECSGYEHAERIARQQAEQWLIVYGIALDVFDVYNEPFVFGGCL